MAPKRKAPLTGNSSSLSAPTKSAMKPGKSGEKRPQTQVGTPRPEKKAKTEVKFEGGSNKGKGKERDNAGSAFKKPNRGEKKNFEGKKPQFGQGGPSSFKQEPNNKKLNGKPQSNKKPEPSVRPNTVQEAKSKQSAASTSSKPAAAESKAPLLPKTFKVIAGSYEKLLYGLEGTFPSPDATPEELEAFEYTLTPIFIFPAHVSSLKAVACSPGGGKWLASGSTDEVVKIWDLRRRKEVGGLVQHAGSITSLTFPTPTHLLSTSDDATISLFRTRDWSVLRSFKGHTGRVNSVAVHPTGKVALSLGSDKTVRMWDLMRGKGTGSVKIGGEGEIIKFSPNGKSFAILADKSIELYSVEMTPLFQLTNPKRFHDFQFYTRHVGDDTEEELLLASTEEGAVRVFRKEASADKDGEGEEWVDVAIFAGHTNRVKAISILALPGTAPLLTSVSSDGFINLYNLSSIPTRTDQKKEEEGEQFPLIGPVANYDTRGTRLTCVTLAEGDRVTSASGDAVEDEESDEEEWGGISYEDEEEDDEEDDEEEDAEEEDGDEEDGDSEDVDGEFDEEDFDIEEEFEGENEEEEE